MGLYGDVSFYTDPLAAENFYTLTRTKRAKIADFLTTDLDDAATKLDLAPRERGRVSRGVAFGLQSKIARRLGRHQAAADAAKKAIDGGQYGLNPNFGSLFTLAGQQANAGKEIMLEFLLPLDQANPVSFIALGQGSRSLAGQSGQFPLQALADKFECVDGKASTSRPFTTPPAPTAAATPG